MSEEPVRPDVDPDVDYRDVFERSAVPQVVCDVDERVLDVNAALRSLLGCDRSALVGRTLPELNHEEDPGLADARFDSLLRGQLQSLVVERVMRGADGRPVPVRVEAYVRKDRDGRILGGAASLQDLRQLRANALARQREEFFAALSRRASDLAIVADADGRMLYISPAVTEMLGYSPAEELLRTGWEYIHPDDADAVRTAFEAVVRDGTTRVIHLRVRSATGEWRHLEETVTNMLAGPVGGLVCNIRDITEEVRSRQALAASEARYRAIAENAEEGIWVASSDGVTEFVNHRMLQIVGLSAADVYARSPAELLAGTGVGDVAGRLATRAAVGPERYEVDYRHPDGSTRHLRVSATPLRDETGFTGSLALVSDDTAARSAVARLEHAATHDLLTDLPNRSSLQSHVEEALARHPSSTAVLFVDLDHFKVVNDARGHGAGDEVLRQVAAALRAAARPDELVARFGGDEFVVVCEGVDTASAREAAHRFLTAVEQPRGGRTGTRLATASIGIALSPAASADQLLSEADTAMYAAKTDGSRSVRFFDSDLAAQAETRFRLGRDLRVALDEQQIAMAYQPIVSLRDGAVLGVEALARWRHPVRGEVAPDVFIPIAEETGLLGELDLLGVERATQDLPRLRDAGAVVAHGHVCVNVSARSLEHPELATVLDRATRRAGLEPRHVVLEVTETGVVGGGDGGTTTLEALAEAGYRIALDDFGTGHSALSYLRTLPVSMLKIDRSFVSDLVDSPTARAVVGSVVALGHGLGMTVVAEGVEDAGQAAVLRDLQCDAGQGWLWSPATTCDRAVSGPWPDRRR